MTWIQRIWAMFTLACLLAIIATPVRAQLSLSVEIDETLRNSQSINVQSLIANNGRGPSLFRMYLQNQNTSEYANNLYFRFIVSSDNIGRIIDVRQVSGQPFSLDPGQEVFATNNNIGNGLPGVEEVIEFTGELTPEGENFVNKLEGSTSLPPDRYSITVEVYQGSVGQELLASETKEIGTNLVQTSRDFYLLSPGDVVGSDASISTAYPNFQWSGSPQTSYRLVVVESKGDESPQSLMDGAMSTQPVQTEGSSGGGALVDYEMLDIVLNRSNFQYPSSGVQNLRSGKEYYWRVVSRLDASSGTNTRESEIWSFSIPQTSSQTTQQNTQVTQALKQVLGDQFQQIVEDGYSFQSIEVGGQVYQGGQALQKLMELSREAQQGDVSIIIEE